MEKHPNVLLVVVDQMRRDALSTNRPGFVYTPHLDRLAAEGVNFTHAYSACPSCIAARASLMTGLRHENHGFTGYHSATVWKYPTTLAGTFTDAGYQTECVGKMHVEPARNLMGFQHVTLHDGYLHDKRRQFRDAMEYDDYLPDVRRDLGPDFDISDTGVGCNGYAVRTWPWGERFHPTSWVTSKAIEFLRRRDPTRPFFLKVSYHRPHSPLDPPPTYFDMYRDRPMPEPWKGDWNSISRNYSTPENPMSGDTPYDIDRARRAYCALVSQIDFELNRLFMVMGNLGVWENTAILFVADHGDMLFDHGLVRKGVPFEGAAGIPLFVRLPREKRMAGMAGLVDTRLAELRDVFPTLCDVAGIPIPKGLDGQSLLAKDFARTDIHGEHPCGQDFSNQWMTDGHEKYAWFSQTGRELLFDLDADPHECHDLSAERPERLAYWRGRLVEELEGRHEGYVRDGNLVVGCRPCPTLDWAGTGR